MDIGSKPLMLLAAPRAHVLVNATHHLLVPAAAPFCLSPAAAAAMRASLAAKSVALITCAMLSRLSRASRQCSRRRAGEEGGERSGCRRTRLCLPLGSRAHRGALDWSRCCVTL